MNKNDKLKLSIYESSLSDVMKYRLTDLIDIYEASKQDADKAEEIGRQNLTLKKGANIVNQQNKNSIEKIKAEWIDGYKPKISDKKFHKTNISDLSRRHKIRSSTRSTESIVPDYGANPRYSKDASDKSIKKYELSKKYKNINIEDSLKNLDDNDTKKKILIDRIKSGKTIPKNISDKLVENKPLEKIENERKTKNYWSKTFDKSDKLYDMLAHLYDIMVDTNDYPEYKKAHDKFAKMTGFPTSVSFKEMRLQDDKRSISFRVIRDGKNDKNNKSDTLYHGSKSSDIKQLTPSFK